MTEHQLAGELRRTWRFAAKNSEVWLEVARRAIELTAPDEAGYERAAEVLVGNVAYYEDKIASGHGGHAFAQAIVDAARRK